MRDYKSYGKEVKRKAAEERQAYRDSLSVVEQLERLKKRPGKSMRETARLLAKAADNKTNDSVVNKKLTSNEKMNRKVLHAQAALQAQK